MSRQYSIRWKQSDNDELRKAVRNFNDKIRRLEKKNPKLKNVLPERVSVRQMKELIETRQDLNRELNALRRFSKRGAEEIIDVPGNDYNLKITKWQKNEMTRRIGIINRKRKKQLEEITKTPLKSRGEELGYTKGDIGMGKAEEVALTPMQAFTPKMSRKDLQFKFRNIMKESQISYWRKRDNLLKANYIKSLEENFNPNDIKDIVETIENMNFQNFKRVFYEEGGNFELSYPPDHISYNAYLSALKTIWNPQRFREDGNVKKMVKVKKAKIGTKEQIDKHANKERLRNWTGKTMVSNLNRRKGK